VRSSSAVPERRCRPCVGSHAALPRRRASRSARSFGPVQVGVRRGRRSSPPGRALHQRLEQLVDVPPRIRRLRPVPRLHPGATSASGNTLGIATARSGALSSAFAGVTPDDRRSAAPERETARYPAPPHASRSSGRRSWDGDPEPTIQPSLILHQTGAKR
jgi:hypothetical protein